MYNHWNVYMKSFLQMMLVLGFISMAVFGFFVPFAVMGHDAGCPLASANSALCGEPLLHISHWQAVFVTILAELIIFSVFILAVFVLRDLAPPKTSGRERFFARVHVPSRPTLLEELFARGILNRRAP